MKIQEITWVKKNKAEVFFCFVFPYFFGLEQIGTSKSNLQRVKKKQKLQNKSVQI